MTLVRLFEKDTTRKSKYLNIIICSFFYFMLSMALRTFTIGGVNQLSFLEESDIPILRGVITQIQILISVYIVLRINKAGYVTAIILNLYSSLLALAFLILNKSLDSLPGVISYLAVIIIISFIMEYKNQVFHYLREIEDQKLNIEASRQKLYDLEYFDAVTKLPNLKLFIEELRMSVKDCNHNQEILAVMAIDLDSFKSVNDTLGYSSGNEVLNEIARRIQSHVNDQAVVCRSGGDEYFIYMQGLHSREELDLELQHLLEAFIVPIVIKGIEFFITASIGVAIYPEDGEDVEQLIKNADMSMFEAKKNGKNQVVFCTKEMKDGVGRKVMLTNHLYRALGRNELFLHYQPQIEVATGEVIGFEALLRWKHPELGLISPVEFIPIAEQTGLIKPIGLWIFQSVCEQCKKCRVAASRDMRLSINLSMEQLREAKIAEQLQQIVEETKMNPQNIEIEITESIAFNQDFDVLKVLKELKQVGFLIAIDDFGKEYSSLNRIRSFPVDLIKIDMDFVHGISSGNSKDRAVVKTIIQLAKNLGVRVLAEGVETEEQYQFLKREGCDEIQGYYFFKPMDAKDAGMLITGEEYV